MEDVLPTDNCPADPEDQEEEEPIQIPGQEPTCIGQPNKDIDSFTTSESTGSGGRQF